MFAIANGRPKLKSDGRWQDSDEVNERNEFLQLGRLLVFAICAYTAYAAVMSNTISWAWLFGLLAVTYNPFIRAHFDRRIWQILDLAAAIVSLGSVFGLKVYI